MAQMKQVFNLVSVVADQGPVYKLERQFHGSINLPAAFKAISVSFVIIRGTPNAPECVVDDKNLVAACSVNGIIIIWDPPIFLDIEPTRGHIGRSIGITNPV